MDLHIKAGQCARNAAAICSVWRLFDSCRRLQHRSLSPVMKRTLRSRMQELLPGVLLCGLHCYTTQRRDSPVTRPLRVHVLWQQHAVCSQAACAAS